MRKHLVALGTITSLSIGSLGYAQKNTWIDPFTNPIKELKLELQNRTVQKVNNKPKNLEKQEKVEYQIFKSYINKPIHELKIQGIILSKKKKLLVVADPQTGQLFFLKEGSPISMNEKIEKITSSKVVIGKYAKLNGKIQKIGEITINIGSIRRNPNDS